MKAAFFFIGCIATLTAQVPPELKRLINTRCAGCHTGPSAKAGLDFATLSFDLANRGIRDRWIRIHDRVEKGEMPPNDATDRPAILQQLAPHLFKADLADVAINGRGPMRRLNRDEY